MAIGVDLEEELIAFANWLAERGRYADPRGQISSGLLRVYEDWRGTDADGNWVTEAQPISNEETIKLVRIYLKEGFDKLMNSRK